ncbi:MAG: ATP-binding cassette domain-containing protein [Oscillatoriales cyanobacterium]|nr:MAG: ATP-binding cassette domain-containing protein [Oscillatoriales cyanobacterium]TAH21535.1 MAG: ATP-binding cassette domain-containing protein [Oscillatoriales cyanobacterium]
MQTLNSQKTGKSVSDTTSAATPFLSIKDVSKVYPTAKGPAVILDGVNLDINEGEFICLIGHSGCGKSTLLNMIAGFNGPTDGEVALQGVRITEPGPDRMVVFQNYSLLPWLTATENIHLGVETVYAEKSAEEHNKIVQEHLELVGLTEACEKRPGQLSGGMKQRVAIARALATRPKLLILDEPFGALDPITREELQEELLKIWQDHKITIIMITHDIDEALFLSDRIVMMTNGPAASIGEDVHIPFSRPRNRTRIMEDPKYYELRNFALEFLFSRYAHTDGDEETDNALPPLPASAFRSESVPVGLPRTVAPAAFQPHASEPSEASRIKGSVLGVSWLFAMSVLAAVNMSSVASQQKQKSAEVAPIAPAAVISSPPTLAAPTAAVTTAPTAVTTAPTAATTAPTAAATTAPTAAATTAPTAAATTAPTAAATTAPTAVATTAPTAATTTAPTAATSEISDKAQLDAIGQKLYAQIDQSWKTTPSFTESLTYRVKVKQNGDIVQFEPTNKVAKDFLKETPLPVLQTPAGSPAGAEKTAEFQVTFSPSNGGKLEVKTGK